MKKLEIKKKVAIDGESTTKHHDSIKSLPLPLSLFPEENFNEAKRLKLVVDELCKAGKMLCRYEVEKKEAISKEDYDAARTAKVRSHHHPLTPPCAGWLVGEAR